MTGEDMTWLGGFGRAFRNRNFAVYTAGSAVSLVGTWLQRATIGWLAWKLTLDPFMVALAVSVDLIPAVLVSPWAGAVADRQTDLRLLFWLQALSLVQAVVLAALAFSGALSLVALLTLTALLGALSGFHQPLRLSLTHALVRETDVAAAVAVNAVIFNLARVAGPAAAGFIIHHLGSGPAFALNAATFVAALVAIAYIRPGLQIATRRARDPLLREILSGYRYMVRSRSIGRLLVVALSGALLVRPALDLMPAYVGQVLAGGPDDLGVLMAAVGAGAMASAVWMAWRGANDGLTRIASASLLLATVALTAFAAATTMSFALACVFAIGLAMGLRGTSTQALIQNRVDPAMRGRVLSLHTTLFSIGPALGALAVGAIVHWVGFDVPLYGAAALNLVVWLWWIRLGPRQPATDEPQPPQGTR